jgi:hypothetical protein
MTSTEKKPGAKADAASAAVAKQPETTQEAATAPVRRNEAGFEIDEWDLPVSGPARANRLEELGLPDPRDNPKAWKSAKTDPDTDVTKTGDQNNG